MKATNDVDYNLSTDVTDCFGNNYTAEQAFSITFSGKKQCRVEFNFGGTDYQTLDYDVFVSNSSRDTFIMHKTILLNRTLT